MFVINIVSLFVLITNSWDRCRWLHYECHIVCESYLVQWAASFWYALIHEQTKCTESTGVIESSIRRVRHCERNLIQNETWRKSRWNLFSIVFKNWPNKLISHGWNKITTQQELKQQSETSLKRHILSIILD